MGTSVCQKCANSALKQSDSVAKSNIQEINRVLAGHWCRLFFQHTVLYIQGTKEKVQGPTSCPSQPPQSGRNIGYLGKNSIRITYSIMLLLSHFLLLSFQCSPSLWYNLLFSHSNNFWMDRLVLLLRQITGHRLQPTVQQQHRHPQRSHFTLTGRFFFKHAFTRPMLALNSSGATFPVRIEGNSVSNRLLSPNTVMWPAPRITTGSGQYLGKCSSLTTCSSSSSSNS